MASGSELTTVTNDFQTFCVIAEALITDTELAAEQEHDTNVTADANSASGFHKDPAQPHSSMSRLAQSDTDNATFSNLKNDFLLENLFHYPTPSSNVSLSALFSILMNF